MNCFPLLNIKMYWPFKTFTHKSTNLNIFVYILSTIIYITNIFIETETNSITLQ